MTGLVSVMGLCTTVVAVAVGSNDAGGAAVAVAVAGTLVGVAKASGVGPVSPQADNNNPKLTATNQTRPADNRFKPRFSILFGVDGIVLVLLLLLMAYMNGS